MSYGHFLKINFSYLGAPGVMWSFSKIYISYEGTPVTTYKNLIYGHFPRVNKVIRVPQV